MIFTLKYLHILNKQYNHIKQTIIHLFSNGHCGEIYFQISQCRYSIFFISNLYSCNNLAFFHITNIKKTADVSNQLILWMADRLGMGRCCCIPMFPPAICKYSTYCCNKVRGRVTVSTHYTGIESCTYLVLEPAVRRS